MTDEAPASGQTTMEVIDQYCDKRDQCDPTRAPLMSPRNRWHKLANRPPYALNEDRETIESFNDLAGTSALHRIDLGYFPEPYQGSVGGPVVLLSRDPGLDTAIAYRDRIVTRSSLRQLLRKTSAKCYHCAEFIAVFLALICRCEGQIPGQLRWSFPTGAAVMASSPALSPDGIAYIGSGDGKLYALDPATGIKKWEFDTAYSGFSSWIECSPVVSKDGTVYCGSSQNGYGKLYALNARTGIKKWEYRYETGFRISPAIGGDGNIYVINARRVQRFAPSGQSVSSSWTVEGWASSLVVTSRGRLIFGTEGGNLLSTAIPAMPMPNAFYARGALYDSHLALSDTGLVFFGIRESHFYCVDTATMKPVWSSTQEGSYPNGPVLGPNAHLYVPMSAYLMAMDANTGVQRWKKFLGQWDVGTPAVGSDGTVYCSLGPEMLAVNGASGDVLWRFSTGKTIDSSPTITNDGTLIFGSSDRNVYALHTTSRGLANTSWPKFAGNEQNSGTVRLVQATCGELEVRSESGRVVLSWEQGPCVLEVSESLVGVYWTAFGAIPAIVNGKQVVHVRPGESRLFFRLRR